MRIKIEKPINLDIELTIIDPKKGILGILDTFLVFLISFVIVYLVFFYIPNLKLYCPDKLKIISQNEKEIHAMCSYSFISDKGYVDLLCYNTIPGNSNISKNSFSFNFTNTSKIRGVIIE